MEGLRDSFGSIVLAESGIGAGRIWDQSWITFRARQHEAGRPEVIGFAQWGAMTGLADSNVLDDWVHFRNGGSDPHNKYCSCRPTEAAWPAGWRREELPLCIAEEKGRARREIPGMADLRNTPGLTRHVPATC